MYCLIVQSLLLGLFQNIETTTTKQNAQSDTNIYNISVLCLNQTLVVQRDFAEGKSWAIQVLSSIGKPDVSEILNGERTWYGNYEDCITAKSNIILKDMPTEFTGHYCRVGVELSSEQVFPNQSVLIGIGLCVSQHCSNDDVKKLINSRVIEIKPGISVFADYVYCSNINRTLDTKAIVALVVLSVIVSLMVGGTAYEIISLMGKQKTPKESRSAKSIDNDITKTENVELDIVTLGNSGYLPENTSTTYIIDSVNKDNRNLEPGVAGKMLQTFSIYKNVRQILNTSVGDKALTSVYGIRFISQCWVILGHTYQFSYQSLDNLSSMYRMLFKRVSFMPIANSWIAVETFFSLSGLLLTYLTLKELKKNSGKLNWLLFYFHRFWRLTPSYMLVLMMFTCLFKYTGNGPIWGRDQPEREPCETTWWYNLLYINNFEHLEDQCMSWTWYLANDMQFFVISPLVIVPLFYSKIIGCVIAAVLIIGSIISTYVVSIHYSMGLSALSGTDGETFIKYYMRPYCRLSPYVIGMLTGYVLYRTDSVFVMKKYARITLWIISLTLSSTLLFSIYEEYNGEPLPTQSAAIYNALHGSAWSLVACWIVFACATGNGGFINAFLSWKGFMPLSKLTYTTYLIHPILIMYYVYSRKRLILWDDLECVYEYVGHLVLSYCAGFIISLAFESPMIGLEKIIRGNKKRR